MSDETKLPKWAQFELSKLRGALAERERELAIARKMAPECGASGKVVAESLGSDGFPLSDRACISFRLRGGVVRVMLREVDGSEVLDINGDRCIWVAPRSGNVAHVRLEK